MPLRHVLYRCPLCGHDPTQGRGDRASCSSCGAEFVRKPRGVEVRGPDGAQEQSVALLVDAMAALGGPLTAASREDGGLSYSSPALFHGFVVEEPLVASGHVLGYVERPGEALEGVLTLDGTTLVFQGPGETHHWPVEDLTALQVSTRSLQVGIRGRGTLQITFPEASTYRWEGLLQHVLRACWQERGWGDITEFQPRITSR